MPLQPELLLHTMRVSNTRRTFCQQQNILLQQKIITAILRTMRRTVILPILWCMLSLVLNPASHVMTEINNLIIKPSLNFWTLYKVKCSAAVWEGFKKNLIFLVTDSIVQFKFYKSDVVEVIISSCSLNLKNSCG